MGKKQHSHFSHHRFAIEKRVQEKVIWLCLTRFKEQILYLDWRFIRFIFTKSLWTKQTMLSVSCLLLVYLLIMYHTREITTVYINSLQ